MLAEKDVERYLEILELKNQDFDEFKQRFSGFYMTAPISKQVRDSLFDVMKAAMNEKITEENVLNYFREYIKQMAQQIHKDSVYFSFITKILSIVNVDLPIWDSKVAEKLLIPNVPSGWELENKIRYVEKAYKELIVWYRSSESDIYEEEFNKRFPDYVERVSRTKKIDFILWDK